MKKIIIIGCSGSGKSTFARKLSAKINVPLYYLDNIWYKSDKTTLTEHEFDERLKNLMHRDKCIIDGNYQRTLEMRLKECDTVFLLDIPVQICLESAKSRIGRKREDLPWPETEFDEDFERWICEYPVKSLPKILELLEKYKADKQITVFKSRDEAEKFLESSFF